MVGEGHATQSGSSVLSTGVMTDVTAGDVIILIVLAPAVIIIFAVRMMWARCDDDHDAEIALDDITRRSTRTLRSSSEQRDRAVRALAVHLAEGRLTKDEFATRARNARAAVTRGDLAVLFLDLPRLPETHRHGYRMHGAYDDRQVA